MNERELEKTLKAIANKRRLAILRVIKKEKEANVADVADKIKLSFKATSKHLGILASVNILEKEQRGLMIFYSISQSLPPVVRSVLSSL